MTTTTIRAVALVTVGLSLTACTLPKLGYLMPPDVGRTPIKKPPERICAEADNSITKQVKPIISTASGVRQ